jgi:hypothetical protein
MNRVTRFRLHPLQLLHRPQYPPPHRVGDRPSVTIGVYMKKVDVKLLKKDIEKLKYAGLDLSNLMR